MKLKYEFEPVDMGDETIMVPIGENANQVHGIIRLNQGGQEIVGLLQTETDENEMITALSEKYENDRETISRYVHQVVETLRKQGLIAE